MTTVFVDYHCHLLPSLDDGAVDRTDAVEIARILADFGFSTVHCTPHLIKGGFQNTPEVVRRATRTLQRDLLDHGVELRLVPGTEHYLDGPPPETIASAVTVGASQYLLVEVPFRAGADLLPSVVHGLRGYGRLPLFAHPERCSVFHAAGRDDGMRGVISLILGKRKEQESLTAGLKALGCRFQGNLGSFAGVYGSVVKQRAVAMLREGLYSCLGSDSHTPVGLADILSSGLDVVVEEVGEAAAIELLTGAELEA